MSTAPRKLYLDRLITFAYPAQRQLYAATLGSSHAHDDYQFRLVGGSAIAPVDYRLSNPTDAETVTKYSHLAIRAIKRGSGFKWMRNPPTEVASSVKRQPRRFDNAGAQYVSVLQVGNGHPGARLTHIERSGPASDQIHLAAMDYHPDEAQKLSLVARSSDTLNVADAIELLCDPGFEQGTHLITTAEPTLTVAGLHATAARQRALRPDPTAPLALF